MTPNELTTLDQWAELHGESKLEPPSSGPSDTVTCSVCERKAHYRDTRICEHCERPVCEDCQAEGFLRPERGIPTCPRCSAR